MDGEHSGESVVGESLVARHRWFGGKLPEEPPPANVVGPLDWFANGAPFPQSLPMVGDFVGGFPRACWGRAQRIPILTKGNLNISDRAVQCALANVLKTMYDDVEAAVIQLQAIMDRDGTFATHVSSGSVFPGLIVARTNAYNVVVCAGVENDIQLAASALYSQVGMANLDGYSTNFYFHLVANWLADQMFAAVVDPALPTLYAGHSLGGVAALIAAVRHAKANPATDVRLLTLGCPRPGDDRLRTLAGNIPSVAVCNVGDWMCQLPPVLAEFYPLAAEVLPEFGVSWEKWKDTPNRQVMSAAGEIVGPSEMAITWDQLQAAVAAALSGDPLPAIVAHGISAYCDRLCGD